MKHLLRWTTIACCLLVAAVASAQTAAPNTLNNGLVAWLQLDDVTGIRALDVAGAGKSGQLVNGGAWHPQGQVGRSVHLTNGAALQVPLAWQPVAFTVSWWVFADAGTIGDWTQAVGASLSTPNVWSGFLFHASASGRVYAGTDINTYIASPAGAMQSGVWQHFTFTFNRGEAAIYKNGIRIAYRSAGMTMPAPWSNLAIGSTVNGSLYANGYYDDLRVYDRALTANEVVQLTASTASRYTPPAAPAANLDRNWTLERTYDGAGNAETNVLAESKQFTDGLGRATQAQARSRANPHVFASETIYDRAGQPVVQTLAAPINNQSFAYKEKFAAVTDGTGATVAYGSANFENTSSGAPDALDVREPGTLGYYYSTANALEPLTPVTAYPFSLTVPATGPLGGLKRAGGPGETFRVGGGHEVKGREIPLLKEFDHYMTLRHRFVPGSNNSVSLQRQGTKSISIDADGRESVVVTNKEGQTLVSCLTGPEYPSTLVFGFISTDPSNGYDNTAPPFLDIHIPAGGEHQLDFTMSGTVRVINLNGGPGVSLTRGGGSGYLDSVDVAVQASSNNVLRTPVYLLPGFYRLISRPTATSLAAGKTQWFNYSVEYGNFSYTYYDDAGRAVATVAPNGLGSGNVVKNPGFDLGETTVQPAQFWQTDGQASAVYTEAAGGAHSGLFHGTHFSGTAPYYAFTHQLITGLPNGRYTLKAWVKGSGGQSKALLLARNFGGSIAYTTIPATPNGPWGDWKLLELPNLIVSNGQCDIGFESDASAGQFIYFDDVVLARMPDEALPLFVTRNTYDTSSRLLATESNDEGRTEYVYARDGRIRFSQSALQRPNGRFSYSNYDEVGRVVESGEYLPTGATGTTFQSQLPASAVYQAEASTDRGGGTQVVGTSPTGYVGYFNQIGAYLAFNITVPTTGTYAVRLRYAAGDQNFPHRTLPLYLFNAQTTGSGYYNHIAFPTTSSWTNWDVQTVELTLTQGSNRLLFQQDRSNNDPTHEGFVNFDYLEVVREQTPTSTSVLNLLEERAPTNSLLATSSQQRNFVTYDQVFTGSGSTAEPLLAGRTQEFTVGAVSKTSNDQVSTWYSYDELGRVTWMVQNIAGGVGAKTLDYTYDPAGNVLAVAYQKDQPDAFYHYYEYDAAQRLYQVHTSTDGTERALQAKYFYYLHGPLKRVELANGLQGTDYTYTLQGWLKGINHVNGRLDPGGDSPASNGRPKDLFGLTLDYFSGDYQSRAQAALNLAGTSTAANPFRYDGTIRTASWRTAGSPAHHQSTYAYDAKSQLTQSNFGGLTIAGPATGSTHVPTASLAYKEGGISYDLNGNMLGLRRTDKDGTTTDNFSYEYAAGTNRLSAVHGGGSPTGPAVMDYDYDVLGQLTRQRDEQGQRYYTYDVTGKTTGMYLDAAHAQPVVEFAYDDRGFRVSKKSYGRGRYAGRARSTYYVRDATGNVLSVYEEDLLTGPGTALQRIEVPLYGSGRVGVVTHLDNGSATGIDDYRYELNDHLGNARVVFHRPTTTTVTRGMELGERQNNTAFSYEDVYRTDEVKGHYSEFTARLDGRAVSAPMTRSLDVAQGDTVTFSAWSLIKEGFGVITSQSVPYPFQLRPLVLLGGAAQPAPAITEGPNPQRGNTAIDRLFSRVALGIGYVLGTAPALRPVDPLPPSDARVRYRLEYEDGTVDEGQEQVPLSTDWRHTQIGVRAQKNGTLTLSVETEEQRGYTYFDDLTVAHTGGLIVQEQHQYAYGSPLVGLNYAVGTKRYRYGYQGQFAEKDAETGFESFELRLYNARIGRWTSNDPEGQFSSPYVGMGNNPVSGTDANGGWSAYAGFFGGAIIGAGIGAGIGALIDGKDGAIAGGFIGMSLGSIAGSAFSGRNFNFKEGKINIAQNVQKILPASGYMGAAIGLSFERNKNILPEALSRNSLVWFQSIATTLPPALGTEQFAPGEVFADHDYKYPGSLPLKLHDEFYWNTSEERDLLNSKDPKNRDAISFYDGPYRNTASKGYFNAELSLVQITETGEYRPLITMTYKFSMRNSKVVNVRHLRVHQPSSQHLELMRGSQGR